MDYFQGVVTEYLRAKRSVFVNTECLIHLDEGKELKKGRHWYCDVMAVDFNESTIYLCEITYSATTQALLARLRAWRACWPELVNAVLRDSKVPTNWTVQPWIFLPQKYADKFSKKIKEVAKAVGGVSVMPEPRFTHLESTSPWVYLVTWDRKVDHLANDV